MASPELADLGPVSDRDTGLDADSAEAEQKNAVATYAKACRLLQLAESRCGALGVHPRGAVAERERFLALLGKMAAMPSERDAAAAA
jgi:hypothetical protein